MALRDDDRLLGAPMVPVACGTCGARVEARKSSWDQTSVQWHADALASCAERRAAGPGTSPGGPVFPGCRALTRAIREAAVQGRVPVQCDVPSHGHGRADGDEGGRPAGTARE